MTRCHVMMRRAGQDSQVLGLARWADLFELVASSGGAKVGCDVYEVPEADGTVTTYYAWEAS